MKKKKGKAQDRAIQFQIRSEQSITTVGDGQTIEMNGATFHSKRSTISSFISGVGFSESNSILSKNDEKFGFNSLFIFSSENKFRLLIQNLVSYKIFHYFIHMCILINSIFLIFETIPKLKNINTVSNHVFTAIFTLECVLKIIAYGFILDDFSYLRDPWNVLDFVVVVTGLISYVPSISANLLALRTFRLIRPLRTISILPRMRIFVSALINSILDISTAFLLLLFFIFIFSIIGLSLWSGRLYYKCRTGLEPVDGVFQIKPGYEKVICGGEIQCKEVISGEEKNLCISSLDFYPDSLSKAALKKENDIEELNYGLTNFDNILNSMFVVFITSTSQGWAKLMSIMMDGYNYYASFVFFIFCVIINNFFMLNLIVAVLLYNLSITRKNEMYYISNETTEEDKKEIKKQHSRRSRHKLKKEFKFMAIKIANMKQEKEKKLYRRKYTPLHAVARKEEIKTLSNMVHIIRHTKCFEKVKRRSSYHKRFYLGYLCYVVYKQPIVQIFFYLTILFNAALLLMERVDMPKSQVDFIEKANFVIVSVFTFELIINIVGLGPAKFFHYPLNIWDFLVVLFSLIEIILKETSVISLGSSSGSFGTIFRTLRVLRVFKLFPQWVNFHIIVDSIWETIKHMVDYSILLIVFLYMYTLLGFSFFGNSMENEVFNFSNFPKGLITVFYLLTGDNWQKIYFKCYLDKKNNNVITIIYFITLILFGHITLINIFIAYLIENFENAKKKFEKNILVRNFILNVMYYCSKAHEIQIKNEKNNAKKKGRDRSMITMLNKVLQRMFNKKLLTEGTFKMGGRVLIDFNKMKKIKEVHYDKNGQIEDAEELNLLGIKIFDFEVRNEQLELEMEKNINDENFYYEYDIDYYDENILEVNRKEKIEMKIIESYEDKKKRAQSCKKIKEENLHKDLAKVVTHAFLKDDEVSKNAEVKSNDFSMNSGSILKKKEKDEENKTLHSKLLLFGDKNQSIGSHENGGLTRRKTVMLPKTNLGLDFVDVETTGAPLKDSLGPRLKKKSIQITTKPSVKKKKVCCNKNSSAWNYMKNSSLFIFHISSQPRIFIRKLVRTKVFSYVITIFILGNCAILAFDNDWLKPNSPGEKAVKILTIVIDVIFIIECLLKIISDDFIMHSKLEIPTYFSQSTLTSNLKHKITSQLTKDEFSFSESGTFNLSKTMSSVGFGDQNTGEEKEHYIQELMKAINEQKAYILDFSNVIDFACVIISFFDFFTVGGIKVRFLKALRIFRSIRPIRILAKSENLNLIIQCLFSSLPAVGNVMIVCGLFIFIFTLLGVNIFKNDLRYYCSNRDIFDYQECLDEGYYWVYNQQNFNNFFLGLKTNFIVMMGRDWGQVMVNAEKRMNSYWIYLYYLIYIIVSYFFILKIILSIVVQNFKLLKKHEKRFMHLSDEEKEWIQVQKMMLRIRPMRKKEKPKSIRNANTFHSVKEAEVNQGSRCYASFEQFVLSNYYEIVVLTIILLSLITLVIQYAEASRRYKAILNLLNTLFTLMFNFELVIKLVVLKKAYFYSTWNRFDFVAIILCDLFVVVNILSYYGYIDLYTLSILPIVLRAFRLLRIVKVFSSFKKLNSLINTLMYLFQSIGYVGLLMLLIIMVFANIGMSMFGTVPYREMINPNLNFRNFLSSSILLFQVATGDSWAKIMNELAYHDCRDSESEAFKKDYYCVQFQTLCFDDEFVNYTSMKELGRFGCGSDFSYYYFIVFIIIGPIFILNLCVVMVIEGFSDSMYQNEGMITQEYMDNFIDAWLNYDPRFNKIVRPIDFVLMLKEIKPPIGFNYDRYFLCSPQRMMAQREKIISVRQEIEKVESGEGSPVRSLYTKNDNNYEFNNFYLSSDKKFFTNDLEVIKILDKLNIFGTTTKKGEWKRGGEESPKKEKEKEKELKDMDKDSKGNTNSQISLEDDTETDIKNLTDNTFVHFVDACLAVSRFAVGKSENINLTKLRPNVVNRYTKRMWIRHYKADKEIVLRFFDNKAQKKLLSEILAAKIVYDGILKKWIARARKRIREKNEAEFDEMLSKGDQSDSMVLSSNDINSNSVPIIKEDEKANDHSKIIINNSEKCIELSSILDQKKIHPSFEDDKSLSSFNLNFEMSKENSARTSTHHKKALRRNTERSRNSQQILNRTQDIRKEEDNESIFKKLHRENRGNSVIFLRRADGLHRESSISRIENLVKLERENEKSGPLDSNRNEKKSIFKKGNKGSKGRKKAVSFVTRRNKMKPPEADDDSIIINEDE